MISNIKIQYHTHKKKPMVVHKILKLDFKYNTTPQVVEETKLQLFRTNHFKFACQISWENSKKRFPQIWSFLQISRSSRHFFHIFKQNFGQCCCSTLPQFNKSRNFKNVFNVIQKIDFLNKQRNCLKSKLKSTSD